MHGSTSTHSVFSRKPAHNSLFFRPLHRIVSRLVFHLGDGRFARILIGSAKLYNRFLAKSQADE
jgi:hypothetical protein